MKQNIFSFQIIVIQIEQSKIWENIHRRLNSTVFNNYTKASKQNILLVGCIPIYNQIIKFWFSSWLRWRIFCLPIKLAKNNVTKNLDIYSFYILICSSNVFSMYTIIFCQWKKTKRGSPVDNRPSTDQLNKFVPHIFPMKTKSCQYLNELF